MIPITPTVKQLLIINIIFFIGSQLVGSEAYNIFSLYYPENENFRVWQPITHMFMHAAWPDFSHILFNMFTLYIFGSALETMWGGKKFLFFYISCGIGAALLHTGINYYLFHDVMQKLIDNGFLKTDIYNTLMEGKYNTGWEEVLSPINLKNLISSFAGTVIGASGATYGLMTAFAFLFPNAPMGMMFLPIQFKAKHFIAFILIGDLVSGLLGKSFIGASSGIANFAHLGGALIGFIMMWYWKKNSFNNKRWN